MDEIKQLRCRINSWDKSLWSYEPTLKIAGTSQSGIAHFKIKYLPSLLWR
jgi:hypothetical protein